MTNNYDELLKALMSGSLPVNDKSEEEEVKELINEYKPYIYTAAKEVFGMLKDIVKQDEFFEMMAKIKKQTYDAYIKVGFTEEQATLFVANNKITYDFSKKDSM